MTIYSSPELTIAQAPNGPLNITVLDARGETATYTLPPSDADAFRQLVDLFDNISDESIPHVVGSIEALAHQRIGAALMREARASKAMETFAEISSRVKH